MQRAKSFFANLLALLATFAVCWPALAFFDEQTGRAGIYAACLASIMLAWGLHVWERDKTFLDPFSLIGYFLAVVGLVILVLSADLWWQHGHIGGLLQAIKYLRDDFPSWLRCLALITAWMVLPFLFASLVRAMTIQVMRNIFGAKPFGLASNDQLMALEERERRGGWFTSTGQLSGLILMAVFWPGAWAIHVFQQGKHVVGLVAFLTWMASFLIVSFLLHRRDVIRMQIFVPCGLIGMFAFAWVWQ